MTSFSPLCFSLAPFVARFEADASEGLSYMHSVGIVHCDHKLVNTLFCRRVVSAADQDVGLLVVAVHDADAVHIGQTL